MDNFTAEDMDTKTALELAIQVLTAAAGERLHYEDNESALVYRAAYMRLRQLLKSEPN